MRILHVTPYAEAAWGYGGIPRVVAAVTRALAARGHRVTVCATDAADAGARLAAPPEVPGVLHHVFPNLSNAAAYHAQLFLPRGLGPFLRRHAASFDVAHLHACHHLPGVVAARCLRRAGVPYVVSPHGTGPRIERRRFLKLVFDVTVGRRVLPGASRVVATSRAEARQLEELGIPPRRLRVVPNPLPTEDLGRLPEGGPLRRRLALGDGEKVVLYLGKLTPRKRVELLVEAFARLERRDVRLVVAGNDMGSGPRIRRRARRLGVAGRTVFTGLLRGGERFEALAAADVVVYPAGDEVFGLVAFESLLCGTPVVVADDSGCGELVTELGGGRVVPLDDVSALTAAVAELLGSPGPAREAALAAGQRVRERFAPDVVARHLEELYEEVASALEPTHLRSTSGRSEALTPSPLPEGKGVREPSGNALPGVSFVVPVHNGERHLADVLEAILAQDGGGRPLEVVAVDDRSADGSAEILARFAAERGVRVVAGEGRGAAAALNLGLRTARHPLVAQVDQDVAVAPGWLVRLAAALDHPGVAAAQGHYVAADGAAVWARLAGADLAARYRRLGGGARLRRDGREVDHVCTGNTLYRKSALEQAGFFDETLGYGYDNDMSYRLGAAGHRLVLCHEAKSVHFWPEDAAGYLRQQYGQGYGRLVLVTRHRRKLAGDKVSPLGMMLHAPAMLACVAGLLAAPAVALAGGPWTAVVLAAALLAGVLVAERLVAGLRAAGAPAGFFFAPAHLLRDLAWTAAIVVWAARFLLRRPRRPGDSMPRPRRR